MGAEQVTVNLGGLDEVVHGLASFDKLMEEQIVMVQSRVAALHMLWEGQAAVKHREAQAEWATGAQLLSEGIKGLHRASAEAHRSFAEINATNEARFK